MKTLIGVVLACAALQSAVATDGAAGEQAPETSITKEMAAADLPAGLESERGAFDGPMHHMMTFRNGSTILMSGGPTYRSIIRMTNHGSARVSFTPDIDGATKTAILALAREKTGQYWQFEPEAVELAAGETKEVLLFIGLNTGRWDRLTDEERTKFKLVCDGVRVTGVASAGR